MPYFGGLSLVERHNFSNMPCILAAGERAQSGHAVSSDSIIIKGNQQATRFASIDHSNARNVSTVRVSDVHSRTLYHRHGFYGSSHGAGQDHPLDYNIADAICLHPLRCPVKRQQQQDRPSTIVSRPRSPGIWSDKMNFSFSNGSTN